MKHLLTIIVLFLATPLLAGPWAIELPTVSKHFGFEGELNEVHPGFGFSYGFTDQTRVGVIAVTKTSIDEPGIYLAISHDLLRHAFTEDWAGAVGLTGGVAWYQGLSERSTRWNRDFAPLGAIYGALEYRGVRGTVGVTHIPGAGQVATLRFTVPFGEGN